MPTARKSANAVRAYEAQRKSAGGFEEIVDVKIRAIRGFLR
jgi:hypothetical protein